MNHFKLTATWRGAETLQQAKMLVDYGVILTMDDARVVARMLEPAECEALGRHFALRLTERLESRLQEEILIESFLVFYVHMGSDAVLSGFIEELLSHPDYSRVCAIFTEFSLTFELGELEDDDGLFSTAVAVVCELGLNLQILAEKFPIQFTEGHATLSHIATYLLSVSNSSNPCIRLSLVHYFARAEENSEQKLGFNRIMSRFGHTVFEHLFLQLFDKKTEAVAMQYILENLPYVLLGDNHCQNILQETFRFYLLKMPDRFCLFAKEFTRNLNEWDAKQAPRAKEVFLKHLGRLYKTISDLSNREIAKDILLMIVSVQNVPFRNELLDMIENDPSMKMPMRLVIQKIRSSAEKGVPIDRISAVVKNHRRGRKPRFALGELTNMDQVTFLGQRLMDRAS